MANAATIRALIEKLPANIFDMLVEDYPDFLDIETWKVDYITWEPCDEKCEVTLEEVALSYGYDTYEDMEDDGFSVLYLTDEGALIIE